MEQKTRVFCQIAVQEFYLFTPPKPENIQAQENTAAKEALDNKEFLRSNNFLIFKFKVRAAETSFSFCIPNYSVVYKGKFTVQGGPDGCEPTPCL